jgi:hypothetical protein
MMVPRMGGRPKSVDTAPLTRDPHQSIPKRATQPWMEKPVGTMLAFVGHPSIGMPQGAG